MRTIKWDAGAVLTVDQTRLPNKEVSIKLTSCRQVASAIKNMKIRGAPLIGVAAAYGLALTAYHSKSKESNKLMKEIEESAHLLKRTRPTAVNLFWAVDRVMKKALETPKEKVVGTIINEAQRMADEDVEINRKIGEYGSKLISNDDVILTHCNAGALATVDFGTALGIIRSAWKEGKKLRVIATETRPKLQGSKLTAYELKRDAIPVILITDNMVGYIMSKKIVNKVIVGADRIVRDGVINKIGTYTIALVAHEHKVPFYVAAPKSTFDLKGTSKDVIIEERTAEEVTHFNHVMIAPKGVGALNPAFDITPLRLVSAIICETGVLSPTKLFGDRL